MQIKNPNTENGCCMALGFYAVQKEVKFMQAASLHVFIYNCQLVVLFYV